MIIGIISIIMITILGIIIFSLNGFKMRLKSFKDGLRNYNIYLTDIEKYLNELEKILGKNKYDEYVLLYIKIFKESNKDIKNFVRNMMNLIYSFEEEYKTKTFNQEEKIRRLNKRLDVFQYYLNSNFPSVEMQLNSVILLLKDYKNKQFGEQHIIGLEKIKFLIQTNKENLEKSIEDIYETF